MRKVILLYGKPATGKLTVAKELQKLMAEQGIKCHVFDNHFFNDILFPYVDVTPHLSELCTAVYKIRDIFLDTLPRCVARNDNATYIFTNVLLDAPDDIQAVEKLKQFATDMGAKFVPVELVAECDTILSRCSNADRATKGKLLDKDIMNNFISNTAFLSLDGAICVNTDKFVDCAGCPTPTDVARNILNQLNK